MAIRDVRAPRVTHVLETSLYVGELARSERFYARVFGFETFLREKRMCAMGVPGHAVLLLFVRGGSAAPTPMRGGGIIPAHDAAGEQHLCFGVERDELVAWEGQLARSDVAVESRIVWPRGGTSLYFRDPDGHSVEIATPGLWPDR